MATAVCDCRADHEEEEPDRCCGHEESGGVQRGWQDQSRAPAISKAAMVLIVPAGKCSTQSCPDAASLVLDWASFMVPAARKARARRASSDPEGDVLAGLLSPECLSLLDEPAGRGLGPGSAFVGEHVADEGDDFTAVKFHGFKPGADRLGSGGEDEVEAANVQRGHSVGDSSGDGFR